jgi:AcrR family transcriptional regulator
MQATDELLKELGYERTTIPKVAERAGMSAPAIYRYFPTKEALLAAWAEKLWRDGLAQIATTALDMHTRRVPVREIVATLITLVVDILGRSIAVHRSLEGRAAHADQQRQRLPETAQLLAALLAERRAEEPATVREGDLQFRCMLVSVLILEASIAAAATAPEKFETGQLQRELVHATLAWLLPTTEGDTGLLGATTHALPRPYSVG